MKPIKINRKLSIYGNFGNLWLTIKGVHIYVVIWKLQILVLPNLYFANMKESVWIKFVWDPLWRIINPNIVMLQQKKCCGSGNLLIRQSVSVAMSGRFSRRLIGWYTRFWHSFWHPIFLVGTWLSNDKLRFLWLLEQFHTHDFFNKFWKK